MLFSATMPGQVVTLARKHMNRPTNVRAESPTRARRSAHDPVRLPGAPPRQDRGARAGAAGQGPRPGHDVLPHEATRRPGVDELERARVRAAAVHGDLGQARRERSLRAFRSGKVDVLVATEVAARGIDIEDITHVINYECPEDENDLRAPDRPHRPGGREGVAVTLVDWDEVTRWKMISDALGLDKPEPAETYSSSEHLFSELEHPAGRHRQAAADQRTRAGLSAEAEEDIGETGRTRSRQGRDKPEVRESTRVRSRTRTSRRDLDVIAGGGPGGGSVARSTNGMAAATDGTAAPERSRRRRRLRAGQDISQDGDLGLAPDVAVAVASDTPAATSAAHDAPAEGTRGADEDDAREDAGQRPPRQRATRARSASPTSTAPGRSVDSTSTAPGRSVDSTSTAQGRSTSPTSTAPGRSTSPTSTAPGRSASRPQAADLDMDDDDEDVPVRPLVASAPITMHAAPGVPAAIFRHPSSRVDANLPRPAHRGAANGRPVRSRDIRRA